MASNGFRPEITTFLAHPDAATRIALAAQLTDAGIRIVGESADGSDAVAQIRSLVPDVALLAVDLPGTDGVTACARLRHDLPVCRVLLLAARDDAAASRGITAGAYGCWLVDTPQVPLPKAVRGTMRRESLPTPGWARSILKAYDDLAAGVADRHTPPPSLTVTEREVLEHVANGDSPATIAMEHDVTTHMVRLQAGYAIIKLYRAINDEQLAQSGS